VLGLIDLLRPSRPVRVVGARIVRFGEIVKEIDDPRARARAGAKERYVRDPSRKLAQNREWRARNPDKMRRARKRWLAKNPEKMRAARKRWREQNGGRGKR